MVTGSDVVDAATLWDADNDGWVDVVTIAMENLTANLNNVSTATLTVRVNGRASSLTTWERVGFNGTNSSTVVVVPWLGGALFDRLSMSVVDVNGDGLVDMAVGSTPGGAILLIQQPGGEFRLETLYVGACALAFGDVDNNGAVDAFCGGSNVSSASLIWHNGGGGNFTLQLAALPPDLQPTITASAFADMDNDGDVDLFVSSESASQLLMNNGVGIFSLFISWNKGGAAVLVDINSDGMLDIPSVDYVTDPNSPASGSRCARPRVWSSAYSPTPRLLRPSAGASRRRLPALLPAPTLVPRSASLAVAAEAAPAAAAE